MPELRGEDGKQPQRLTSAALAFCPHVILFAAVSLVWALGLLAPVDNFLMDTRFRILDRAPSDTLVIVEIDPRSLREEARWPWPRDRYATVVANLQNAGASLIGFDIDFSSRSDSEGDTAFESALARRPGEVVLPVFSQRSEYADDGDSVVTTPPNSFFLQNAVMASVNLTTEENGMVRRGWRGVLDGDAFRGSMAAVLAEYPGVNKDRFYIDYSIDPAAIDRLSFRDVLLNDFPREAVEGKKVLIGSTALELGDEFAAPIRGVVPGVVLHAVSYESLVQGRAITRLHFCIPLFFALCTVVWFTSSFRRWTWRMFNKRNVALLSVLIGAPVALQAFFPVSLDVGPMLAAQLFCVIYILGNRINHYTKQILQQRAATAHFQALTRLVVRDSADGVIVADIDGVIELCSTRAQELLGITEPIEAGSHIGDYTCGFPLHAPDTKPLALAAEALLAEDPVCREYTAPDGSDRTLEILSSSAGRKLANSGAENSAQLVVYTLRDISARKRIEAAEREAKEAALSANAIKTQLISNMSHELKTPLNGIIGFADILKKESLGPLGTTEYQEYSEMIHASGKRLSGLVSDMLMIAKLQAGEYDFDMQSITVNEIVECCVDETKLNKAKAERTISTIIEDDLPSIAVDVSAFSDMLKRLLANALEHTSDEGWVCVRAKRESSNLVLEVIDNGCGVNAQSLPKLKDMFYQADASLSRQHEGAGLGLYIVSELASLHGGSLKLRSKLGVGFLAQLRFPGLVEEKHQKTAA